MSPIDPPKRGRPKGSKTRPKWLREREAQQPKRTRGRPKGSKNKPKDLETWLATAMAVELPPKPPPRPKKQSCVRRENNWLNQLSPEERRAQAQKASNARKKKAGRAPGTPPHWATHEYAPFLKEAKREARRIYDIMAEEGSLPEDPLAREALLAVLELMRLEGDKKSKHTMARTILEFRLAKPTTKTDVTVRSAEDWLADLAAQEGNEPADD